MNELPKLGADLGRSIEGAFDRFKGALERGDIKVVCACHKQEKKENLKWILISLGLHSLLLFSFFLYFR